MKSMRLGSLATVVAAIATMLVVGGGALHAQESNDAGRMRATGDTDDYGQRRSIVPGVRIAHMGEDGTFIMLRDGTVWEVYLPDRTSTAEWLEGDFVIVKEAPLGQHVGQDGYSYELINGRAKSVATVRFKGRSS